MLIVDIYNFVLGRKQKKTNIDSLMIGYTKNPPDGGFRQKFYYANKMFMINKKEV
jgi:hypothetical protein